MTKVLANLTQRVDADVDHVQAAGSEPSASRNIRVHGAKNRGSHATRDWFKKAATTSSHSTTVVLYDDPPSRSLARYGPALVCKVAELIFGIHGIACQVESGATMIQV